MPRSKRLPSVEHLPFLQPTDRVERRDGRLYVLDTEGFYAPIEVLDEETMDLEALAAYRARVQEIDSLERCRWHILTVANYAAMSREARLQRLGILRGRYREFWRARYGDAMFAVVDQPEEPWSLVKEIAWHKAHTNAASQRKEVSHAAFDERAPVEAPAAGRPGAQGLGRPGPRQVL